MWRSWQQQAFQKFFGECVTDSQTAQIETGKLEPSDAQDWKGAVGEYETFTSIGMVGTNGNLAEVDLVMRRCIDSGGCSTGTTDYELDQVNILMHSQGMERLQAWPMFDTEAGILEGACFFEGEGGDLLLERG